MTANQDQGIMEDMPTQAVEKESTHFSTVLSDRIASSKDNNSPLPSTNDMGKSKSSRTNIPSTTIAPGHNHKDSLAAGSSTAASDEEPKIEPRAVLMAMLNKRGATSNESIPVPQPAAIPSSEENGTCTKSVAKNALSAMFAERAQKESAEAHNISRDGTTNALLSSMLTNRAPPQASNDHYGSSASQSEDRVSGGGTGHDERPALNNDPKYEKYFKMLKMSMPLLAVQHAMARDGLDPSVMDGDHNLPEPRCVPLKDDPTYSKYFKMLKLGLPMGAVKNAMERDGIDPSIMDGDHNAPVSSSSRTASTSINTKQEDAHRRTRIHWDTLEDTKVNSNSVWALVGKNAENQIGIDQEEFMSLFQAEIKAGNPSSGGVGGGATGGGGGGGGGSNRNVVPVIDPKRANNGGIILAPFKCGYGEMAKAVNKMYVLSVAAFRFRIFLFCSLLILI